jgi:hypothetical protein
MRNMPILGKVLFAIIALSVYVEPALAARDEMDFQITCESGCEGDQRVHYCLFEEYDWGEYWACGNWDPPSGAIGYMFNWCSNQSVVSPGHIGPPWFSSYFCFLYGENMTNSGGFTCSYTDNNCLE